MSTLNYDFRSTCTRALTLGEGGTIIGNDSVVPGGRRRGRPRFAVLPDRGRLCAVLSPASSRHNRIVTITKTNRGSKRPQSEEIVRPW